MNNRTSMPYQLKRASFAYDVGASASHSRKLNPPSALSVVTNFFVLP